MSIEHKVILSRTGRSGPAEPWVFDKEAFLRSGVDVDIPIGAYVCVKTLPDDLRGRTYSNRMGYVFDHWPGRIDGYTVMFGNGERDYGYFARDELTPTGRTR